MAKITWDKLHADAEVKDINLEDVQTQPSNPLLKQLLSKMESLEKENKELSKKITEATWNKADEIKKAKEKYKWPLMFSYRIRQGYPVLSYESFLKDANHGLTYVDARTWAIVNNQMLKLTVRDNNNKEKKEIDADMILFGKWSTKSDKINGYHKNWSFIETLDKFNNVTFKTEQHWEFTVLPSIIN